MALASAVFSNLLLDKVHDESLIEMDSRVVLFFELIVGDLSSTEVKLLLSLGKSKGAAELSLSGDFRFDELVNRHVEHVVLDGQVGARGVNIDCLLVVNKNDFGAELRADIGDQAFLRDTSVKRDLLNSLKDI